MVGAALGVPVLVGEAVVGSVVLVLDAPQAATIRRAPANPMIGRTPAGYGVAGPWYTGRQPPVTVSVPFMPSWSWPFSLHMNV